jgi:hypothetical protein
MFDEGGLAESERNYHIIAEWRCPNTRSVDRSFGGDPYSAPRACKTVFEITRSVLTAVALIFGAYTTAYGLSQNDLETLNATGACP